uniref:Ral guanine nucleotide dissociation stimulator-like 3 n=1 Tax=Nothobranchius pienaari TaxID=704102 RepID=A0A1A8MPB3_9TELE
MSPTIRATVAQFNAVTTRVIMSLLSPPADGTCSSGLPPTTPAQRACIIEKWIKVAQECRRLKNFSSLKAILSALHSNAVHRLRKSWAAVCRDSTATFQNLWETFSDENCVLTNKELLYKRSISMNSLPEYNRQGTDSCIIRVSVDLGHDNGNMYKSILVTSQEKSTQVIQRALEKHHLEHMKGQDFTLAQVISQKKELLIPDKANVFYAMSTTANFDFVLRQNHKCQKKLLRATASRGRLKAEHL